jgi:hypothetical protein
MRRFALPLLLLLSGCPDPEGLFDDFVGRTARDLAVGDQGGGAIHDISGTFLLSLAATIQESTPLQFLVQSTLTQNGDGTATLNLAVQPLSASDRMPVGEVSMAEGTKIDANGQFTIKLGTQMVPGEANPITGSPIVATLDLLGIVRSKNRFCGDVMGMVTSPTTIDLAGSKWGAIRVPAGTVGQALPPPDVTCPVEVEMPDMAVSPDLSDPPDMSNPADLAELPDGDPTDL